MVSIFEQEKILDENNVEHELFTTYYYRGGKYYITRDMKIFIKSGDPEDIRKDFPEGIDYSDPDAAEPDVSDDEDLEETRDAEIYIEVSEELAKEIFNIINEPCESDDIDYGDDE